VFARMESEKEDVAASDNTHRMQVNLLSALVITLVGCEPRLSRCSMHGLQTKNWV
jgi:hypothetical protein